MLSRDIEPGTPVRITEDCRPGRKATGQIGTYEGEHPRSVILLERGDYKEYTIEAWKASGLAATVPDIEQHQKKTYPEPEPQMEAYLPDQGFDAYFEDMRRWARRCDVCYWFTTENPRIRLAADEVIWGDECWWEPAAGAAPLPEAQAHLAEQKQLLVAMLTAPESI